MCGRYYLGDDSEQLGVITKASERAACSDYGQSFKAKTGEIFPSDIVPVLTMDCKPTLMKWGFTKSVGKGLLINARSETVKSLSTFSKLLQNRRCLIPASAFFEWKTEGTRKQKYSFSINEDLLYMAGLYRQEANMPLPCFVVLTQESMADAAKIHPRMPVVFKEKNLLSWFLEDTDTLLNNACYELLIQQA